MHIFGEFNGHHSLTLGCIVDNTEHALVEPQNLHSLIDILRIVAMTSVHLEHLDFLPERVEIVNGVVIYLLIVQQLSQLDSLLDEWLLLKLRHVSCHFDDLLELSLCLVLEIGLDHLHDFGEAILQKLTALR